MEYRRFNNEQPVFMKVRRKKMKKGEAKNDTKKAKKLAPAVEETREEQEMVTFIYEGVEYKTLFTKKFAERKPYSPPNPKKVIAFIPGIIIDIFVKTNLKVSKGDLLLSLQAMKMNNEIIAPKNGTIKKVHIKMGDVVVKNQLLVEFR